MGNDRKTGRPILVVKDVTRVFGEKRALDSVSLEVSAGCIFGFVGPNGAGKTTLIRSIVGVAKPDSGDIRIAGQSVITDALACKRLTAYVPDNPDIYEFLTGMQYLDYMADIFEVPADLRAQRIGAYAERLGIADDLGSLISAYSMACARSSCSSAHSCTNRSSWSWMSPSLALIRGILPYEGDAV